MAGNCETKKLMSWFWYRIVQRSWIRNKSKNIHGCHTSLLNRSFEKSSFISLPALILQLLHYWLGTRTWYISSSIKIIYTNNRLRIISLLLVFKKSENILVSVRHVIFEIQFICQILRAWLNTSSPQANLPQKSAKRHNYRCHLTEMKMSVS